MSSSKGSRMLLKNKEKYLRIFQKDRHGQVFDLCRYQKYVDGQGVGAVYHEIQCKYSM
jgi:hypothetical protein